jgi:hypothetical protein
MVVGNNDVFMKMKINPDQQIGKMILKENMIT